MAYRFSNLYDYMRTLLNDLDPSFCLYSNDQLDNYILWASAINGSPERLNKEMKFVDGSFASIQEEALFAAKAVLTIFENMDSNSFSTRIYSVGNSAQDVKRKIQALQAKIEEVEDGDLPVLADGDWTSLFGITAKDNTIDNVENDYKDLT